MLGRGDYLDDIEVLSHISTGGMGRLFLGRRKREGFTRTVAIKSLHPQLATDPQFVAMFLEEARILAKLTHPNVVHVEELRQSGSEFYIVMEYVDGPPLSVLARSSMWRLSLAQAAFIVAEIASGLHAAHEAGVVHRDISPHNVLVSASGHVKLIDFGIAKSLADARTTQSLRGKLGYMSPEQARGERLDRRTDVYSMGVVLWELVSGRPLFKPSGEEDLLSRVQDPGPFPPLGYAVDEVLAKALAAKKEDRYATAIALRKALLAAVPEARSVEPEDLGTMVRAAREPDSALAFDARAESPPTATTTIVERPRRSPVFVALGAALLLAAIGAFVWRLGAASPRSAPPPVQSASSVATTTPTTPPASIPSPPPIASATPPASVTVHPPLHRRSPPPKATARCEIVNGVELCN